MGMLGRAFAGVGAGVASLAGKYIDEEMAANRAKMLADLQHESAVKLDKYNLSPERQDAVNRNATSATLAKGAAERQAAMAAAGDAEFQAAQDKQALADAERKARGDVAGGMIKAPFLREQKGLDAQADAATARDITKASAADKDFLAAQSKIALADPKVAAQIAASRAAAASAYANAEQSREQTKGVRLANEDKQRLGTLYDSLTSTLYDDKLSEDQRASEMRKINTQIQAIKAKNGMVAGRDPELDTETITEKRLDADGNETTVTRKRVRRPGEEGPTEKAPYPDGTELRGKDGQIYVVQDGRPVPKNQAARTERPAAAKPASPPPKPEGNYAMFEAMDDEELVRYAKAGNAIAKEVAKERQAKAARTPLDTRGAQPDI